MVMAAVQWASRGQKLHTAIPSGQDKDRIALRVTSEASMVGFGLEAAAVACVLPEGSGPCGYVDRFGGNYSKNRDIK